MSWMGKILGGGLGFILGGPIGAVLGAVLGHHTMDSGGGFAARPWSKSSALSREVR